MAQIIDIFLYNGERLVLGMRHNAMKDWDVQHVAVVGTHTFQGQPQDVQVPKGVERIAVESPEPDCPCCKDAIRWSDTDAWQREAHQRNASVGFLRTVTQDDTVLHGDVDEIPDLSLLDQQELPFRYLMEGRCFTLTWHGGHDIPGTVATTASDSRSPSMLRHGEMPVRRGGWHLSYQGGVAEVSRKLRSFSHVELSHYADDAIGQAIRTGIVPWTGVQLTRTDPPPWLRPR